MARSLSPPPDSRDGSGPERAEPRDDMATESAGSAEPLFARYRMLRLLGKGGMGVVFLAHIRSQAVNRPSPVFSRVIGGLVWLGMVCCL
jgi:serine/threonine protein kinase